MKRIFLSAIRLLLACTIFLGILYPLLIAGVGRLFFPEQSRGSIITHDDRPVGSRLIAQDFTGPGYFHPRPSASGHDPMASGGTNLAPSNPILYRTVLERVELMKDENPDPIPIDLVLASASGLDPDISVAAAVWQSPRVARSRGIDQTELLAIIIRHTDLPLFGFIGESRVNVLLLNLYLDQRGSEGGGNDKR